jgi:YidC/Oxa1 family membrane protein insertase
MGFLHAVYQLLIGPLQLIYEFIYYYARMLAKSWGLAIIVLSLVVNFLLLPMYRQADAIQDKEREAQKRMAPWVKHIKKTFSGNERFMMLQTYYRQNNYKPYYTLRGLLPLVLEIPFFMAAYRYLSGLNGLQGIPFGIISDLSKPDALLPLFGLHINVLPILMTAINIVSGAIYTKGLPWKDKLQLYGMAGLFLILLYDSPAGLVVYWTMNNLFSLVKNIIGKLKNPRRAKIIVFSTMGALCVMLMLIVPKAGVQDILPLSGLGLLFQIPLLRYLWQKRPKKKLRPGKKEKEYKPSLRVFLGGSAALTILTGILIPTSVIASSPIEFVDLTDYRSPLMHVLYAFLLAAGLFLIWFGLFYYLSGKKGRARFGLIVWILAVTAAINYMFFGTHLGTLSAELKFDETMLIHLAECLINIGVLIAVGVLLWLVWKKSRLIVEIALASLCVALFGMSVMNIAKIKRADAEIQTARKGAEMSAEAPESDGRLITLSKNKQNVVVIMLDRAIGSYVPFMLQEKPELQQMFDGFTYYPNTLSFGGSTNFAAPALYGGYAYTPVEINKRDDETLADKHDEALKVMPVLFDENGYDVTVIEPPYAGYSWVPDLGIYADYPDIRTYNVEHGQMYTPQETGSTSMNERWERNFFCYSVMKASPVLMQIPIYLEGTYFDSNSSVQYTVGLSESHGINVAFMNSYAVMEKLSELTAVRETEEGAFLMMSNSMTHEPQLLQTPDYVPRKWVQNQEYDEAHADRFTVNGYTIRMETAEHIQHYHVNLSALLRLAEWFDTLREQGVYDNTRIIIVSDHGYFLKQHPELILGHSQREDMMGYNPLLLVKDFNSTGFMIDNTFMTNADVPTITLDGVVDDPKNPFTGEPINSDAKAGEQYVFCSGDWDIVENNGNTFKAGLWYSVHDDIFDPNNWTKLNRGVLPEGAE